MFHIAGPTHDWTGPTNEQGYRRHFAGTCPGQTTGPSALVRRPHAPGRPRRLLVPRRGRVAPGRPADRRSGASTRPRPGDDPHPGTDLARAKARGKHLLVAYHDPYFTSTTDQHGPRHGVKPWVDVIDRYDVRLTLSASQHNYERTCPVLQHRRLHPGRRAAGTTALQRVHRRGRTCGRS